MKLVQSDKQRVILDFDIENRPLSYWYGDVTTAEITAIAWTVDGGKTIEARLQPEVSLPAILEEFWQVYASADLVTGHYIRKHDLPQINAALMEYGMPLLPTRDSCDTKLDLAKRAGQPATLAHLGDLLGVDVPKFGMSQMMWRGANRLDDPELIAYAHKRVTSDVLLHVKVREELIARGWLAAPRKWHSVAGGQILVPMDA